MKACWHGELTAVKWLVQHGADLLHEDQVGGYASCVLYKGFVRLLPRSPPIAGGQYGVALCSREITHPSHGLAVEGWDSSRRYQSRGLCPFHCICACALVCNQCAVESRSRYRFCL